MGLKPSNEEISAILSEIDVTYNGQLEIQDYLQVDEMRRSNFSGLGFDGCLESYYGIDVRRRQKRALFCVWVF